MCQHKKSRHYSMAIQKYIPYSSSHSLLELLQQFKMHKLHKYYEVDTSAMQHDYRAVQLLPYDCHYNPLGTGDVMWQARILPSGLLTSRSRHLIQQTKYRLLHGMIFCSLWKTWKSGLFREKFPYLAARICHWRTQAIQTQKSVFQDD